ncbi:sodium/potassium-transporting ATPase subunit beta-1-like [Aricia agestis]|uniref:sodium/potassium-transporting ATPase subunit beta-1-like n=1 Tax=Aricia agestis TaxID=91739 RepID=UPI001C20299C|nr:sodium/potassium-transporting ATPase subunit beta-1-like [Aricia agestis]
MWKKKQNLQATSRASGLRFKPKQDPWRIRVLRYFYNKEQKLFCGRTWKSWLMIIGYSLMYFIFLATYTMIFLYCSLLLIQDSVDISTKSNLVTYLDRGIGLSAIPTSFHSEPLIWYVQKPESYGKYVNSIENLLSKRRKRDTDMLGPCGAYPYGYGEKPCVIIKINKQLKWSARPVNTSSTNMPWVVKNWMQKDKDKLWLYCTGLNGADKEHIGIITYHPDPPGFDVKQFPMDLKEDSPLIAIQISDFSHGLSLTIQCSLWYEGGVSTTEFVLYVK